MSEHYPVLAHRLLNVKVNDTIVKEIQQNQAQVLQGTPPLALDIHWLGPRFLFIGWFRCPGVFPHTKIVKDWKSYIHGAEEPQPKQLKIKYNKSCPN